MSEIKKLVEKSNVCLPQRVEIPSAPLWHMGKVAAFDSKESFDLLQNTVDYLTCKGQANLPFTDDEKEFMKELFEALWWGGKYHGYDEAAALANHYVNGGGKVLKIPPEVYKTSIIVSDAMVALKDFIKDQSSKKQPIVALNTGNATFLRSVHSTPLKQVRRSVSKQGYILHDGALLVEQSNQRLKNADHRFYLTVNTTKNTNGYISRWSVESLYDFEPFSKGYVTDIPLTKDCVLKLPDGLSHHLTKIGVAQDFKYGTDWQEMWK